MKKMIQAAAWHVQRLFQEDMMTNESLTLFIPLYGKALMSREGFLPDPAAEDIVATVDYDFTKVDQSRKLAIYMAMRAALFDGYAREFAAQHPESLILQLGVGLDSRAKRVSCSTASMATN